MNPELVSAIQKVSSIIKYDANFYEGPVKDPKKLSKRAGHRGAGGSGADAESSADVE